MLKYHTIIILSYRKLLSPYYYHAYGASIAYETKAEKELKVQLAENEKQIESLQTQINLFKQIHKIE